MQVELKADGEMVITPDNELESYALSRWVGEYDEMKESYLTVDYKYRNPSDARTLNHDALRDIEPRSFREFRRDSLKESEENIVVDPTVRTYGGTTAKKAKEKAEQQLNDALIATGLSGLHDKEGTKIPSNSDEPMSEETMPRRVGLPYGIIFTMDGSNHVFSSLKQCWCDPHSKTCEKCGGYMHYQSVHNGDFYRCEGCNRETSS